MLLCTFRSWLSTLQGSMHTANAAAWGKDEWEKLKIAFQSCTTSQTTFWSLRYIWFPILNMFKTPTGGKLWAHPSTNRQRHYVRSLWYVLRCPCCGWLWTRCHVWTTLFFYAFVSNKKEQIYQNTKQGHCQTSYVITPELSSCLQTTSVDIQYLFTKICTTNMYSHHRPRVGVCLEKCLGGCFDLLGSDKNWGYLVRLDIVENNKNTN